MKYFCNLLRWAPLWAMLLLITSCSTSKTEAIGNPDEIFVFADSLDWLDYQAGLDTLFGKEYLTPAPEPSYLLAWRSFEEFTQYRLRKNVLFLARLDGQDRVSLEVKKALSQEVLEGIQTGEFFYIPRNDVWAREQYVVYLVAPDKDAMLQRIYDLGELVFDDFEKSYYTRLQEQMYENYENKKVEDYLRKHFPFTLRVQHDYQIASESLEERYVWLRRIHPSRDRALTVHWIPFSDSARIDFDWIVQQRNRLAAQIYQNDVVVEDETRLEQVRFGRWPAYRLEGTWKNPQMIVGGPFRTIVFADKESGLIFMIDFYVQAIGERKKTFLDQLDVMAHTFRTNNSPQPEG
ncbi:MAG: DUF4837 family protein [Calditrichaceae bacterium]|nr:DUF4837 family protein [Calditrichia bacterium]NUQ40894.1 DUF4837 family protein [Calditrichaceae bacterium]